MRVGRDNTEAKYDAALRRIEELERSLEASRSQNMQLEMDNAALKRALASPCFAAVQEFQADVQNMISRVQVLEKSMCHLQVRT